MAKIKCKYKYTTCGIENNMLSCPLYRFGKWDFARFDTREECDFASDGDCKFLTVHNRAFEKVVKEYKYDDGTLTFGRYSIPSGSIIYLEIDGEVIIGDEKTPEKDETVKSLLDSMGKDLDRYQRTFKLLCDESKRHKEEIKRLEEEIKRLNKENERLKERGPLA